MDEEMKRLQGKLGSENDDLELERLRLEAELKNKDDELN
jgi:hypothetical protein